MEKPPVWHVKALVIYALVSVASILIAFSIVGLLDSLRGVMLF